MAKGAIRAIVLCLSLLAGAAAVAQETPVLQSPILLLEVDRLYGQSAYGRRVTAELEAAGAEIANENRRIEAELTAEERDLTDRRPSLEPAEFRELAAAFDEKVQEIRREQDAKARALGQRGDEARRGFLSEIQPVLAMIMRETGAAVILDRRSVIISADVIDITDLAIARIDAAMGDGAPEANPDP